MFVQPSSGPDEREPLGQVVPGLLDRLEEVVGAVDLVHLAGLGVADDDGRAVHAPRHRGLGADDALGLELRAVVGRGQLLALVEVVLAEQALVHAGDRDRGGQVEGAGLERVGELDGVPGAVDVGAHVRGLVGGHVVDRGEVEEVVDVAAQRDQVLLGHAEPRREKITSDWLQTRTNVAAVLGGSLGGPADDERLHLLDRPGPVQEVDVALAIEQPLDQVASDEPCPPGHEVGHGGTLPSDRR